MTSRCKSNWDESSIHATFSTFVRDTDPSVISHAALCGPAVHQGSTVVVAAAADAPTAVEILSGYSLIMASGGALDITFPANVLRDVTALLKTYDIVPAAGFRLPPMYLSDSGGNNVTLKTADANISLDGNTQITNNNALVVDMVYTSATELDAICTVCA